MTKKFLEINFTQSEQDQLDGFPPELIRLEAADDTAVQNLYYQLRPTIADRPHTAHIHTCNHSAAGNAPCNKTQFAEVKGL